MSPVRDVAGRTHIIPVKHCVWLAAHSLPSVEVGTSVRHFDARWPGSVSGPGQVQAPADRSRAPCPGGTLVRAGPGAWLVRSWQNPLWRCVVYLGPLARVRLRFLLEHDWLSFRNFWLSVVLLKVLELQVWGAECFLLMGRIRLNT